MKNTFKAFIAIFVLLTFIQVKKVMAFEFVAKNNKQNQQPEELFFTIQRQKINRVSNLRNFFKSFNSPLEPYSEHFVATADKYGLDYRLLPAIACNESTCGKFYPINSNNPFGWGIYGNTVTSFETMEKGIETVAKGLVDNYVSKGLDTVEKIAPVYTPPNPTKWARNVNYFYGKIDKATSQVAVAKTLTK